MTDGGRPDQVPGRGIPGKRIPSDAPPAPDGSDRALGRPRRPDPAPVRGPAAGVPDLSSVGLLQRLLDGEPAKPPPGQHLPSDQVRFQHASERRFARLLDFYGVAWMYEPDEYPIEWDDKGQPTTCFRPDFYIPAFDLYIEITTSKQRLVTRKNRKLRLLRQHHPKVRCKLFYQRDYLALLHKYGLDDEPAEGELTQGEPAEGELTEGEPAEVEPDKGEPASRQPPEGAPAEGDPPAADD